MISQCPWVICAPDHIYTAARTCPRSLRSRILLGQEFIKCCAAQGHACTQTNNLQVNCWLALPLQVYTTCTGWTISSFTKQQRADAQLVMLYVACQEGKQSVNQARQRFTVIITCTKFDKKFTSAPWSSRKWFILCNICLLSRMPLTVHVVPLYFNFFLKYLANIEYSTGIGGVTSDSRFIIIQQFCPQMEFTYPYRYNFVWLWVFHIY